jgi:ring-1,2-phenylacetyl-CoA epoxidase subunit PaaA
VDKEENFHLRHGETWMRKINEQPGGHEELQRAVDWMFPLTMEWFGLPDDRKRHTEQIDYGFKGSTNDQLRQIWMSTGIPFLQSLDLDVPVHWDEQTAQYAFDFPFPARFVASEKSWLFEEGPCTWDDVMVRWKARGPMNQKFVEDIQRGYNELHTANGRDKRTWHEVVTQGMVQ